VDLPLDQILLGDCLDLLRDLPSDSIDATVVDPPYGLGNKDPSPEDIFAYVLGCTLDTGNDFMGQKWSIPSVAVWREVYRVLKPGGHVLSFGGTRTFDLISIGLRMAGFECRDTIGRNYPILQWIQGQGMPKSHDISKGIDNRFGKTRTQLVGIKPGHEEFADRGNNSSVVNLSESGPHAVGFSRPWMKDPEQVEKYHHQYAPASDEAKHWSGWGSGLKPAFEPILVFRKPLEGTLASNVLKHGTGGLNIDATRVRHASQEDFETHKKGVDAIREKGGSRDKSWKNDSDLSGANEVKAGGRWPSNVVLEHSESCQRVGSKKVAAIMQGTRRHSALGKMNDDGWQPQVQERGGGYGDDDGNETVEAWECAEGCPVRALDAMSGDRPSTLTGRADPDVSHEHPGTEMNPTSTFLGERTHLSKVYADAGGASRFFTQIEADSQDASKGRWPSNVLLEHVPDADGRPGCQRIGSKRIKGSHAAAAKGEPVPDKKYVAPSRVVYGSFEYQQTTSHVGSDGLEETEAWECVEGCPVKALDDQSGNRRSSGNYPTTYSRGGGYTRGDLGHNTQGPLYDDEGGASRFFTQIEADKPDEDQSKGRWPSNAVFEHVPDVEGRAGCQRVGIKRVTTKSLCTGKGRTKAGYTGGWHGDNIIEGDELGYAGFDGKEEVADWICVEGCPVKALDDQSGERRSSYTSPNNDPSEVHVDFNYEGKNGAFSDGAQAAHDHVTYQDAGGASRFFTQFEADKSDEDASKGRWPPNAVFIHAPGCERVGLKDVKTPPGGKRRLEALGIMNDDGWQPKETPSQRYAGPDGLETVEDWICVEGCPVRALREQGVESGHHPNGGSTENKGLAERGTDMADFQFKAGTRLTDEGGVDRFFTQFDAQGGVPFRYIPKANRKEAGCGEFEIQHPTLKPLALIRWLVKLVTQKGGTVLDMYAGSGTTLHAAVLEGMHFIGMERDPTNHAEAVRRLEIVMRQDQEKKDAEDLHDFAMGRGE
jgi:site-specific DNA-methyltransferase (adenine-specific)